MSGSVLPTVTTPSRSSEILQAFVDRSWRSNAERQLNKGIDLVIGKRDGYFIWDLEGERRWVDCGSAGGVHSLGHHPPMVADVLRKALDDGRDTGLWSIPNAAYLQLQDLLTRLAPIPSLNRSVITLASTVSVDVATMFAFRFTGRQKMLAYRHGYHGHSGFAALVTGSHEEGIIDYYNLPKGHSAFFDHYGDLDELEARFTDDVAAVIVEAIDYETFAPASEAYLKRIQDTCRRRKALFILDETRTGIGRTGTLWACSHYDIEPDMIIAGKGLSGGIYPVSALLVRQEIYDVCMNQHKYAYISSLGGNEMSCLVARKVLEIASDHDFLSNVQRVMGSLKAALDNVCSESNILSPGTAFGGLVTVVPRDAETGRNLSRALFEQGVLVHSVSEIPPYAVKFLPPLVLDEAGVKLIAEALKNAATKVSKS